MMRLLEENDRVEFLRLLNFLSPFDYLSVTQEKFAEQFQKTNNIIFVVSLDNRLVATGSILIEHKFIHSCGQIGHIEDVVVDPKYRGRGLGGIVLAGLVDYARAAGCYKVILDCSRDNLEFYEKCGFACIGVEMAMYFVE